MADPAYIVDGAAKLVCGVSDGDTDCGGSAGCRSDNGDGRCRCDIA